MQKHLWIHALALLAFAIVGAAAWADDDRVEHFEGKAAKTIEQALDNLHLANQQLADLLASGPITAEVSHEIHQLTYTLENALEHLEDELDRAQEILEQVHLASEANQGAVMATEGPKYLELSQRLFGPR